MALSVEQEPGSKVAVCTRMDLEGDKLCHTPSGVTDHGSQPQFLPVHLGMVAGSTPIRQFRSSSFTST